MYTRDIKQGVRVGKKHINAYRKCGISLSLPMNIAGAAFCFGVFFLASRLCLARSLVRATRPFYEGRLERFFSK